MISIIDVKDFIDLDKETLYVVHQALGFPTNETIALAQQLLATESGLLVLHHMFRDQIAEAGKIPSHTAKMKCDKLMYISLANIRCLIFCERRFEPETKTAVWET